MKSIKLICALFLMTIISLNAQQPVIKPTIDTFNVDYLKKYTSYFKINASGFEGEGAQDLISTIQKAQYTVLGEYHGSSSISQLTGALLPVLKQAGYENFAIEVGPHTANKLEELAKQSEQTQKALYDYNSQFRYAFDDDDDIPIPFFDGVEDAAFLAKASELGFDLWGLDQEYFSSVMMWSSELLNLAKHKSNFKEIQQTKAAFDSLYLAQIDIDNHSKWSYRMFDILVKDSITQRLFSYFNSDDDTALSIIEALKKTWDIYDRNSYRGGYSHGHRISYIRENFIKHLETSTATSPKVFTKIGAFHAGKNYAGSVYDVGNLIHELAQSKGEKSVHIQCMDRFHEEEGKVHDDLEKNPNSPYRYYQAMAKKDQWTLIDLAPIRQQIRAFNIHLMNDYTFHRLKYYTENFDYILITPLDKETTPNYDKTANVFKSTYKK